MAEAAAARREARRKKILENSQSRLQFLTGRSSDSSIRGSPVRTADSSQDIEFITTSTTQRDDGEIRLNEPVMSTHRSHGTLPTFGPETAAGDGESIDDPSLAPRAQRTPQIQRTSLKNLLLVHKYDMVLISILMHFFYIFFPVTNTTNLFLPIFIYSVTKIIWFPPRDTSNAMNPMVFINSLMSNRLKQVIYIAQSLAVIVRDIFVYLFVTVCIQSTYEYITT